MVVMLARVVIVQAVIVILVGADAVVMLVKW